MTLPQAVNLNSPRKLTAKFQGCCRDDLDLTTTNLKGIISMSIYIYVNISGFHESVCQQNIYNTVMDSLGRSPQLKNIPMKSVQDSHVIKNFQSQLWTAGSTGSSYLRSGRPKICSWYPNRKARTCSTSSLQLLSVICCYQHLSELSSFMVNELNQIHISPTRNNLKCHIILDITT